MSASVTADLTGINVLNFRMNPTGWLDITIYFDGVKEGQIDEPDGFQTLEISGLDYGTNTTVKIEGLNSDPETTFRIDYVRGLIQTESRKVELVDIGGL